MSGSLISPSAPQAIQAMSAAGFISHIGINAHLNYWDTSYNTAPANVLSSLQYLGISQARIDASIQSSGTLPEVEYLAANGIKFDAVISGEAYQSNPPPPTYYQTLLDALEVASPGSITSIENYNEVPPSSFQTAISYEQAFYQVMKADPVLAPIPILQFSVLSSVYSDYTSIGNTTAYTNAGNVHVYSSYLPPAYWDAWYVPMQLQSNPGQPFSITETGYATSGVIKNGQDIGVNQDVQAKYMLDNLFDLIKMGASTVYEYELYDERSDPNYTNGYEDYLGLFNVDHTPKEAATALHNLTTIIADPGQTSGSFTPASLAYSISGLNSTLENPATAQAMYQYGIYNSYSNSLPTYGNSFLLQKSNGTFDLAVWQEPEIWNGSNATEITAPTTPVVINFAANMATINIFDPLIGTSSIQTFSNTSQVTIGVSDHPVIVEINPFQPIHVTVLSANVAISDAMSVNAFAGLSITDPNVAQTETVTVTLSAANGILSDPNSSSDGSTLTGGSWSLAGTSASVTAAIDGLVFIPTAQEVSAGKSVTTNLTVSVIDTAGQSSTSQIAVTATAVNPTATVSVGTGPDVVALRVTEDYYLGNAQFLVDVDGVQVGGIQTATAQNSLQQSQTFDFFGSFGKGNHLVTVTFINDAYTLPVTPTTDRNLYVLSASYDGIVAPSSSMALLPDGPASVTVGGATPAPVTIGAGGDTLKLTLAEQAYYGDAQFQLTIDGSPVGGVQTVTAVASAAQSQDFYIHGNFGAGPHNVGVTLVDPYSVPGYPLAARTISVLAVSADGNALPNVGGTLSNNTPLSFSFSGLVGPISVATSISNISDSDFASVNAFKGLTINDPNASQTETATVSISNAANGVLSDPNVSSDGSTMSGGVWTIIGTSSNVATALNGLVFTPTPHQVAPGGKVATIITATVVDTAGQSATAASTINVTASPPLQPAIKIITGNVDGGVTLSGVSEANSTVTVIDTKNGTPTTVGTATTSSTGLWQLTSHTLVDTATINSFSVSARDTAGNTGSMPGALFLTDTGSDSLTATPGVSDVFAIMSFKGADIISGFKTALSSGTVHDYLDFSGRGITSFNQLQSMMTGGSSTIITIGGGKTITLAGVAPTSLTTADFRYS